MTKEEYLNLVTSANREQPDFIAKLSVSLELYVYLEELLGSMIPKFDVDEAVGDQLDIIGLWVGASREVSIPITGAYFEWDGLTDTTGWDYGSWQPADAPSEITTLPDDAYRTLIKFKIAANSWDGTTPDAYRIWELLFPEYVFLIQDNQNMTYDLAITGGIIDSLTLALIRSGSIALKPEGVRIDHYYLPFDDGPIFGWDADSDTLKGWDEAAWAEELSPI